MDTLAELMERQSGVISRKQALASGMQPHDVRRLVRRREWAPLDDGVFVDHTGDPTWLQRAWAAVLLNAPAALCHESAIRAVDGPGRRDHDDDGPIHVAIDRNRKTSARRGVVVHRLANLDAKALWAASPPRLRIEEAAIDVAAEASNDFEAIAVLAGAVQSRRTTATRLLRTLSARTRLRRRAFLKAVLLDVKDGACSALEHAYLVRVERRHGLPTAERQVVESRRGPLYRDVVYRRHGVVVELDGRLFHSRPRERDRDLERDLDAAVDQLTTVRLGWGQAVERPCTTARKICQLLAQNGWTGRVRLCPDCR